MDLGFGSGNAAIAARLMGYNVTVISTPSSPNALVASRLVDRSCTQLWGDAFKEILPPGPPRLAVDQAMTSYVPIMEDYLALDGSTSTNTLLHNAEVGQRLPMETELLTGTPLHDTAATTTAAIQTLATVPTETAATAQMADDEQMARDTQLLDDEPQPRRSSMRSSLGTAT